LISHCAQLSHPPTHWHAETCHEPGRVPSTSQYLSLGEWPRLSFTARIERAQFHRARSASKKGTWPFPPHPSQAARSASRRTTRHTSSLPSSLATSPKGAGSWSLNCTRRTTTIMFLPSLLVSLHGGVVCLISHCAQLSHPPTHRHAETCHEPGRGPSNPLHLSLREWPRLPFTARIERAQFHRARSASKNGTWPLPSSSF